MKEELEKFIRRIPDFEEVSKTHTRLVTYFGFFLTEVIGELIVTPVKVKACYDAAKVSAPRNVSDVIQKSRAFVKTGQGLQLHREVKARILSEIGAMEPVQSRAAPEPAQSLPGDRTRSVVVVHGRDESIRESIFQFLLSLRLNPLEWNTAVQRTGQGSPYIGVVLDALFRDAQAVVVVLTPDERVELRQDLQKGDPGFDQGWQPRPNVYVEAGMALAKDEARTILVQVGEIREASDLSGRHAINLDGGVDARNSLVQRLKTAGCALDTTGNDWLRAGNFGIARELFSEQRRKR